MKKGIENLNLSFTTFWGLIPGLPCFAVFRMVFTLGSS